jgi:hypothetical protein
MGQQQLLLIILGVIVVGIAVAVGITMFSDSAISANRDALTNDLVNLASKAQQYYRRPTQLGGGGNSFAGLVIGKLTSHTSNANGCYTLGSVSATGTVTQVEIEGIGTEKLSDGTTVKVHMYVWPSSDSVYIVN